jgi:hypothetical protein
LSVALFGGLLLEYLDRATFMVQVPTLLCARVPTPSETTRQPTATLSNTREFVGCMEPPVPIAAAVS